MNECQKVAGLASGKKIRMVDATASNAWVFYFTDGSNVCIHTDGSPLKASEMGTDGMLTDPFKPTMVLRQIELRRNNELIANIPTGTGGFIPWDSMPGGGLDYATKNAIRDFAEGKCSMCAFGPWRWNWKK